MSKLNITGDWIKCEYCGKKVKRGILSVSQHWLKCPKNTKGVIKTNDEGMKKLLDSWSINVPKDEE